MFFSFGYGLVTAVALVIMMRSLTCMFGMCSIVTERFLLDAKKRMFIRKRGVTVKSQYVECFAELESDSPIARF